MNDFSTEKAVALNGEMTVMRTIPLDRAKAISDLIAEQALASERMGRLTDKVATALLDANLFSVLVPEAEGGLGGTGVELFEATEEIARADGSAGWCMAISNAISGFVCKGASAEAREEVFGNGPVACWATLLPKATSVGVKGGFFGYLETLPGVQAAHCHAGCWYRRDSRTAMANNGFALTCCLQRMPISRKARGM